MPTIADQFVYDVTTFPSSADPAIDLGKVINDILADISGKQTTQDTRPGATIYIPPGHYYMQTQVVIGMDHIQIKGSGHGWHGKELFYDEVPPFPTSGWYSVKPGGSHVILQTPKDQAAFRIATSTPNVSGIEFRDFCIDGSDRLTAEGENPRPHTVDTAAHPARIGIAADSTTDSLRIEGMTFLFMHTAISGGGDCDAAYITNNVMGECGAGIELHGAVNTRITNNSFWCDGDKTPSSGGYAIWIDANKGAVLIEGNILDNWGHISVTNSHYDVTIVGNRISSWWPLCIDIQNSNDCFVSNNHIVRNPLASAPVLAQRNVWALQDDTLGVIRVQGARNTVSGNFINIAFPPSDTQPSGAQVPGIRVVSGSVATFLMMNRVSSNNGVFAYVVIESGASQTRCIYSASVTQLIDSGTATQSVPTP
jgi:inulin fructotransferase (DFA-I-forming)